MTTKGARPQVLLLFTIVFGCVGLGSSPAAPAEVSAGQRQEVIEGLTDLLDELYVIPETADAIIARLRQDLESGRFDDLGDPSGFAAALTGILQEMSGDQHLRVSYDGPGAEGAAGAEGPGGADGPVRIVRIGGDGDEPARQVRRAPGSGAAPRMLEAVEPFPRVEMLAGNVGCVEVRLFAPREMAEEKAVQAMEAVSGADAVVFDLRGCMGGAPDMIHLITSYLYGPEPMHVLTYYHAHEPPDSAYTLADVPGRRMPGVPVYIVTSAFTASGGEEFTYNLKHHGRATVVGEKTAGAGHGGGVHPLTAGFSVFMPDFRPVHPVTGRGWEGVGVEPDLEAPADKALAVAHREALLEIVRRHPERGSALAAEIERLEAEIAKQAEPVDTARLAEYAGEYGIRTIRVKEDGLYLQRTGGPELLLAPSEDADTFQLKVMPSARIRFVRNEAGEITELHVRNMEGEWEVTRRAGS